MTGLEALRTSTTCRVEARSTTAAAAAISTCATVIAAATAATVVAAAAAAACRSLVESAVTALAYASGKSWLAASPWRAAVSACYL